MTNKDSKETNKRLIKLIRTPAKVLTKARDLYIQSLTGCAGQVSYGTVMGCPTGQFSTVSRSSSSSRPATRHYSSTTTTHKDAIRSSSFKIGVHQNSDQAEAKPRVEQQETHGSSTSTAMILKNPMPRSFSLGVIGRIDEDKPYCEFEEDDLPVTVATDVLLRSTSCCFKMNWTS